MWWKIYFWFYVLGSVLGLVTYTNRSLYFVDLIDICLTILVTLGIYSYVYKKSLWKSNTWKVIFWFLIIGLILELLYMFTDFTVGSSLFKSRAELNSAELIIGIVLMAPSYYAVWQLGKAKKLPKKKKK